MKLPLIPVAVGAIVAASLASSVVRRIVRSIARRKNYAQATMEYQDKLKRRAEVFFSSDKSPASHREEYELLLDAYEIAINGIERMPKRSKGEKELLLQMLSDEKKLLKLYY
ncbi:MAG: hypothetical protein FWE19_02475 [Oscillospiraceae bacterium]|nr:hypothetical protein [Oscillospiraceae bacterium]